MFAARGNVQALDRARRVGRHVSVLALCAVGLGVGLVTPAQADKISDTKAEANRVWEQIQSDGQRLEQTIERYNGARFRLSQTMERIDQNEMRLATARVNLKKARHALNITIISAYKNPQPDPLEAALSARNFGQVLDQFALLDRAQSYNAGLLTDIRDYRKDVDRSQRMLNRERNARRDTVAELTSLKSQIPARSRPRSSATAGSAPKVRRLIEARRAGRARRVAARRRARAPAAGRLDAAQAVAVNDIGGVEQASASASDGDWRRRLGHAPRTLDRRRVRRQHRARAAGHALCLGRRRAGRLRLLGPRLLGLRAGRPRRAPHFTGALWNSGTHISSQSDLAPGDLVFFHGSATWACTSAAATRARAATGDVVKISTSPATAATSALSASAAEPSRASSSWQRGGRLEREPAGCPARRRATGASGLCVAVPTP